MSTGTSHEGNSGKDAAGPAMKGEPKNSEDSKTMNAINQINAETSPNNRSVLSDPSVELAAILHAKGSALSNLGAAYDEGHPEGFDEAYEQASDEYSAARQNFEDAPVQSIAGALAKVRRLKDNQEGAPTHKEDIAHIDAIMTFLQDLHVPVAASLTAPADFGDDPTVQALEVLRSAADRVNSIDEKTHLAEYEDACKQCGDAYDAAIAVPVTTLASAIAKLEWWHQDSIEDRNDNTTKVLATVLPILRAAYRPEHPSVSTAPVTESRVLHQTAAPIPGGDDA